MERPEQRPRSKSTFSLGSNKSGNSSSKHAKKASIHETSEEKHRHALTATTKANPNAAMNEAQPIAAALEKPTLQSLRSFQHKDKDGILIEEPDLSNPTRSRWERPLDTIRSFEAAIDGEYRRRAHTMRAGPAPSEVMSGYGSRRSSYYGGYDQNRYSQVGSSGYYGSRQAAAARESWADNGNGYGPSGGPPRARMSQRMQTEPSTWNRYNSPAQGVYPNQNYQQSRDTVNTGGSGSNSDPYNTDPNSENSSIERATPVAKPDLGEQYGFSGFGGGPILEEHPGSGLQNGYFQQQQQQYSNNSNVAPPVPAKTQPPVNNPNVIKLSNSQAAANEDGRPNILQRNSSNKRKSWLKRRFSKN